MKNQRESLRKKEAAAQPLVAEISPIINALWEAANGAFPGAIETNPRQAILRLRKAYLPEGQTPRFPVGWISEHMLTILQSCRTLLNTIRADDSTGKNAEILGYIDTVRIWARKVVEQRDPVLLRRNVRDEVTTIGGQLEKGLERLRVRVTQKEFGINPQTTQVGTIGTGVFAGRKLSDPEFLRDARKLEEQDRKRGGKPGYEL